MMSSAEWRSPGPLRQRRVALVAMALSLTLATALYAHQTLLRSHPAKGEQVAEAPTLLQLIFREPIQAAFTKVTLLGPDSGVVSLGDLRVEGDSGTIAALPIVGSLAAGRHVVTWRTTGADGHAVSGSYNFRVLASAVQPTPTRQVATPPEPGAVANTGTGPVLAVEGWPYVLIRWLTFASLLGVLGAVFFRVAVLATFQRSETEEGSGRTESLSQSTARFGRTAALILGVATFARLGAQMLTMLDPTDPLTMEWITALLGGSTWGKAWMLQMAGLLVAWWGFGQAARPDGERGWIVAGTGALALAVTPPLSGHAIATTERTLLAVSADTLHIVAAGGWMGGLAVLVLVGLPTIRRGSGDGQAVAVAGLVNAFSPPALVLGALVGLTGVVGAWLHLGALSDLWSTRYGQTLSVKLLVVGVLFGLGALNFLRVRPVLGQESGTRRLRRSAGLELVAGIIVLLVTAVLVALPPAMTSTPDPGVEISAPVPPPSQD